MPTPCTTPLFDTIASHMSIASTAEHEIDHTQLHALDRLRGLFEPPCALRPAQRLHDLVPRLSRELLDQLLDRQDLQRDQRLAELAAVLGGARNRGAVLVFADHAG